jgi:NADPH:quinone reductase-like Zn-dependent oxidoreductase
MANMKAIMVEEYSDIMKLVVKRVPRPEKPQDHDILVR